jgi:hypothetical protein
MRAKVTAVLEIADAEGGGSVILLGKSSQRVALEAGGKGTIALFPPGRIVAYAVADPTGVAILVFRTLAAREETQVLVAGVRPHVRLLVAAQAARQTARLREALRVVSDRVDVDALDDDFFLRLASCLRRRTRVDDIVHSLLLAEERTYGLPHHRRRLQHLSRPGPRAHDDRSLQRR